ncbi:general APC amino acid permease [Melanogaster broomeanus]|nr:general APC amino acid permease [Melanogaster broomeanus]
MNPATEAEAEDQPRLETFTILEVRKEKRLLKQYHVQMQVFTYRVLRFLTFSLSNRIAIAGTLGTGLFLGSGEALTGAGPLGALIAYALVSTVAFASLCAVGEMTSFAPIPGTFPRYASRWVDPALGFAVGWNYFYTNAITVPVEISGAQLLIGYWDLDMVWRWYYSSNSVHKMKAYPGSPAELMFSFLKLTMITVLIMIGLVIDLGGAPNHEVLGFKYWKNPGPFSGPGLVANQNLDQLLGFLSVLVQALFSFQGLEIAAIAAVVTESPRRNVAMAIRLSFFRILIFYILAILIAGMIVPSNDPDLLKPFSDATQANVTESPFVITMQRAGIKTMASVVNAGLITSAFSAGNSFLFAASRILQALAFMGQAPAIFKGKEDSDTPYVVLSLSCCGLKSDRTQSAFSLLSFLSVSNGASTVFRLSTVGDLLSWATINLTYLYFYKGLKHQNIDRTKFVYWSRFQPWLSIWGLFMCIFVTLINGFQAFWNFKFNRQNFVTSYINIPLFICLYAYWKISKKTEFVVLENRDYKTLMRSGKGIPPIEATETERRRPNGFWEKVSDFL